VNIVRIRSQFHLPLSLAAFFFPFCGVFTGAQDKPEAPRPQATAQSSSAATTTDSTVPVAVSLSTALALARKNSIVY